MRRDDSNSMTEVAAGGVGRGSAKSFRAGDLGGGDTPVMAG